MKPATPLLVAVALCLSAQACCGLPVLTYDGYYAYETAKMPWGETDSYGDAQMDPESYDWSINSYEAPLFISPPKPLQPSPSPLLLLSDGDRSPRSVSLIPVFTVKEKVSGTEADNNTAGAAPPSPPVHDQEYESMLWPQATWSWSTVQSIAQSIAQSLPMEGGMADLWSWLDSIFESQVDAMIELWRSQDQEIARAKALLEQVQWISDQMGRLQAKVAGRGAFEEIEARMKALEHVVGELANNDDILEESMDYIDQRVRTRRERMAADTRPLYQSHIMRDAFGLLLATMACFVFLSACCIAIKWSKEKTYSFEQPAIHVVEEEGPSLSASIGSKRALASATMR